MRFPKQDIRSPRDFEQLAALVRPEDFAGRLLISSDPEAHRREIQRFLDLGFDRVYLHNVGRNQAAWIDLFGREVLPKLTA
jgi:coenzyme F420-dependent glucose-6-phosphate dehydrogenase